MGAERAGSVDPLVAVSLVDRETEVVIPVAEEVVRVDKRSVETGRVRVALTTEVVEEVLRETLRARRAVVEHVPLGHEVTEVPQVRHEGDVLIVPVVEEILVVEKRLVLKEEIHLRLLETERVVEELVERRVQRALVERTPPRSATPPQGVELPALRDREQEITP